MGRERRPVSLRRMAPRSADGPILLCVDGSGPARRAVEHSAALLAPAPALVVHVWLALSHVLLWSPVFPSPGPLAEPAADIDDACRDAGRRVLDDGLDIARRAGFQAEPLLVESRHGAWRTITALADERDARVIVLGSHGISPVTSVLLGSVAAGVVHHATRPVLVVPAERRG
jgi:nucleotide-binding universal stress UspA family protein